MPESRSYRIGQIVPSSNTTMETEVPAILRARERLYPERFTFHSSRMRMHRVTAEELARMNVEGERCAAELADARVDVMSTACLVALMAMGPGYHQRAEAELAERVRAAGSEAAVMTSAGALLEGLSILKARKIALLAPYTKELTRLVVKYIEDAGVEVLDAINFDISDNLEVGRRDPMQLLDDVMKLKTANADAVVLSVCVQMPSLPAVQIAQDRLGLPVTSTAICTARGMLDRLGLQGRLPGFGSLMSAERRASANVPRGVPS
jgi:maleate isomerase